MRTYWRFWLTITCFLILIVVNTKVSMAGEKYANIINPVRGRELWKDKGLKPLQDQYLIIKNLELKATWLIQDKVTEDDELVREIKTFNNKQELGIFLEIDEKLARKSKVYYPVNRPWYSPEAVFLSGYSRKDRVKLIDRIMLDFKNTFGYLPKSVGAWWIDSFSLKYLETKYGIRTALIVADQKTTDSYGVWGQWWGYPYYPAKDNILVPGDSKVLIVQWALRDPVLAYDGEGPKTSNYSLQANDYISQGLGITYFENLANIYFDPRNKLGQITVGLETGIESVGFIDEYQRQLEWIRTNKINAVTMTEMESKYREVYGGNPGNIYIENWIMTPSFRENQKLGEKTRYLKGMVFKDYFEKDASTFLNRIYSAENLNSGARFPYLLIAFGFATLVGIYFRINWLVVGAGVLILKMIETLRYSVVGGERMVGFLIDNFRFVGVTNKVRFISHDLSNLVAQTMLKIEVREICYLVWLIACIVISVVYTKHIKSK